MKIENVSTAAYVAFLSLLILAFGGWIANIVKLAGMLDGEITAMFVARVIGVFAGPLGAVLGFF